MHKYMQTFQNPFFSISFVHISWNILRLTIMKKYILTIIPSIYSKSHFCTCSMVRMQCIFYMDIFIDKFYTIFLLTYTVKKNSETLPQKNGQQRKFQIAESFPQIWGKIFSNLTGLTL